MANKRLRGVPRGFARLQSQFAQLIRENGQLTKSQTVELADYVCVSLAKFTEPYGMGAKAHKAGNDAVARDIRKTVAVISPHMQQWLKSTGITDKASGVTFNWMRGHTLKTLVISQLDLTASPAALKAVHEKYRVHGKVKGTVGRDRVLTTSIENRERFIREQQKLVGLGKSGWIAAMSAGASKYNPPKWLRSNATKEAGKRYIDGNPSKVFAIHVHNNIRYVDYLLRPSKIDSALAEGYSRTLRKWERGLNALAKKF